MVRLERSKWSDYGSLCMTALGLQIFVPNVFENHRRVCGGGEGGWGGEGGLMDFHQGSILSDCASR